MSNSKWITTTFGGIQWLLFMFTNTIVIPLSVGAAFGESTESMASTIQRSFLFTGIACILQAYYGHRLSLMEGQSGVWWGVILSLCATASTHSVSLAQLGGALAIGIICSGIVILVLGLAGMGNVLQKLFTPVVMAVFLFLLASQLINLFFKGMMGLSSGHSSIQPGVALLSFFLVALVVMINLTKHRLLNNFSILIGIIIGWFVFVLLFPHASAIQFHSTSIFELFPFGKPYVDVGIFVTAILTGLINTTNTVASLRGSEGIYRTSVPSHAYRRSFFLTGTFTIFSGVFGMVPYAPYTSSLGFLRSTRILQRAPFVIGALLFSMLGLFPWLSSFFSTLPISVGDAVLFVAYLQLFGSALQNLEGLSFTFQTIYRIALPTLLGFAIMNLPPSVFSTLPALVRPILSNGLLIGILLSILLEHIIRWEQLELRGKQQPIPEKSLNTTTECVNTSELI